LLSLYYLPNLKDPESSFPLMINLFLPVGLKGIMVASMLAAYMSTVVTHFNLGASYIINDFYQPFINPHKSTRHYVVISQLGTLFIAVVVGVFCTKLTSILGAYKYLAVMFGGIGTVMIARWYWWRVNAYSEIAAIITSLVVGNLAEWLLRDSDGRDFFGLRVVITVFAVTAVWVMVTFLTSAETPDEHTIAFYKKMRISGWGWKKVAKLAKAEPIAGEFGQNLLGWLSCVVFIFAFMIMVGKLILQEFKAGFVYLLVAAVGGYMLRRVVRKMRF
jgi:SSS family solute:Na+ symporter